MSWVAGAVFHPVLDVSIQPSDIFDFSVMDLMHSWLYEHEHRLIIWLLLVRLMYSLQFIQDYQLLSVYHLGHP